MASDAGGGGPMMGTFSPPDPGRLVERLRLQENTATPAGSDAYADVPPVWTTRATRWAEVLPVVGRRAAQELVAGGGVEAQVKYLVTLRYFAGLTAKWRFLDATGKALEILSVVQPDRMKIWHQCVCVEAIGG